MAGKKKVAVSELEAIPSTASVSGELEAPDTVTAEQGASSEALAAAANEARKAGLAKARAIKAARAAETAAKREAAAEEIQGIQAKLAAEAKADKFSFGEIREVRRTIPTAEEYVKLEMPLVDLFDHTHPGVQLNRHKFEPGKTYQLRGDVALEVRRRLAMFEDEQKRLLRPNADRKALADVNRGSQWTSRGGNSVVPLGRLEDIPTASDEVVLTVDF